MNACAVFFFRSLMYDRSMETTAPAISIIVPVYHVEQYLERCLNSILGQSDPDFELILINDGGTDAETAICERYAARDERIIYRRQENQGLSAARNTGLALCRGEWLMFVDSDDWVHRDFCRNARKAVQDTGADIAIFDLAFTWGNSPEGQVMSTALPAGTYTGTEALAARLRADIAGFVWNKIYRRSLWEGVLFPVGENWEDDAVMHILLDRAEHAAIIHDVLYYKPLREGSITWDAEKDFTDTKWVFLQRTKRYEYLMEHHPELLPLTRTSTAAAVLRYCCVCRAVTKDEEAYRKAQAWISRMHLYPETNNPVKRFVYWTLITDNPLFRIAAAWKIRQLRKERGIQQPFCSEKHDEP